MFSYVLSVRLVYIIMFLLIDGEIAPDSVHYSSIYKYKIEDTYVGLQ